MSHAKLVKLAEDWLRRYYRCGIVLSEQTADSGEVPDVIGWKAHCHSILVECKVSRADFLADRFKWARLDAESGMGCERLYLTPRRLLKAEDLPSGWGLLECDREGVKLVIKPSRQDLRTLTGMMAEMHLLLASLRRVEVRIEPQSITDFLKWKNRLAEYNGGRLPEGIISSEEELNAGRHAAAATGPST